MSFQRAAYGTNIFMTTAQKANDVRRELLPKISGALYEKAYNALLEFCSSNDHADGDAVPSKDLFLLYFKEISGLYAPSTLWSKYSMINTIVKCRHNVDLKVFSPDVTVFLKKLEADHTKSTKKVGRGLPCR